MHFLGICPKVGIKNYVILKKCKSGWAQEMRQKPNVFSIQQWELK